MKKKLLVPLILTLAALQLTAQNSNTGVELSKFVPASPEAASLGKYGEIPVSNYTGTANISIPLYDINVHDLEIPISLSYHSSGIKVEEAATSIGIGWSLNAGGAITRSIRSRPDDALRGYIDGNRNASKIEKLDIVNDAVNYLLATDYAYGKYDAEPDVYYISAPGLSAKFIFDEDGKPHFIPKSKLRLTYNKQKEGIQSFIVITPEGISYTFGGMTKEGNRAYEYTEMTLHETEGRKRSIITAWYLLRISTPLQELAEFEYRNREFQFESFSTGNKYHFLTANNFHSVCGLGCEESWAAIDPASKVPNDEYNRSNNTIYQTVLKQIKFSGGDVFFYEQSQPRIDLPGTFATASMTVMYRSRLIKSVRFVQDYSTGRLTLKSVIEGAKGSFDEGGNPFDFKEYKLDYYPGVLPDRNSFSQDHWGYFNGKYNNTLVPPLVWNFPKKFNSSACSNIEMQELYLEGANRFPDLPFTQTGSLSSITYPLGGKTTIEYEPNVQSNQPFNYAFKTDMKACVTNNDSLSCNPPNLEYNRRFTIKNALDRSTPILVASSGLFYTSLGGNNRYGIIEKRDASGGYTTMMAGITNADNGKMIFLKNGDYQLRIASEGTVTGNYYAGLNWQNDGDTYYAGGLRVKRFINEDLFTPGKKEIKRFEYLGDDGKSSGKVTLPPEYAYVVNAKKRHIADYNICALDDGNSIYYTLSYLVRTSASNYPLTSTQSATVGYSKVTVYNGENGEGGKTDYYYSDIQDNYQRGFPFTPPTSYDYLRGNLIKEIAYEKTALSFDAVSETQTEYGILESELNPVIGVKIGFNPKIDSPHPPFGDINGYLHSDFYNPFEGALKGIYKNPNAFVYAKGTTQVLQSQEKNGLKYETKTETLEIDLETYLPSHTLSYGSAGEELHTYITYNSGVRKNPIPDAGSGYNSSVDAGYYAAAGLQNLENRNVKNLPLEIVVVKKIPGDENEYVIDATLNFYHPLTAKLAAVFKIDMFAPMLYRNFIRCYLSAPSRDANPYLHFNESYTRKVSFSVYDYKGNILEQQKDKDNTMTYVWDYDKLLPTAEVLFPLSAMPNPDPYKVPNTRVTDTPSFPPYKPWVAHTSFETDDGGNWIGVESSGIVESSVADCITGKRYFSLGSSGSGLKFDNLLPNVTYLLSFWASKDSQCFVEGGPQFNSSKKELEVRGNWQLIQFEISGTNLVSLYGKAFIDELRVYPKAGKMTTYTFDPLIGVTTICDDNNQVLYYEYNHLNQLKMIRNKDRNILKMVDYRHQK